MSLSPDHRPHCQFAPNAYLGWMSEPPPDSATIGGTPRATSRPDGVKPPSGWQPDAGPPAPEAVPFKGLVEKGRPDPVRYGDWELKGIAIDF